MHTDELVYAIYYYCDCFRLSCADRTRIYFYRVSKEALAKRKSDGFKLGKPVGQSRVLELDVFHDEITDYLKKCINKRAISKLIECSPSTLYKWLKRRKLYKKSRSKKA